MDTAQLAASGIRPSINNIVDITNYVMIWTAMHAFDYDQLVRNREMR